MRAKRGLLARLHCAHRNIEGIYGDEINAVGGYRLHCIDCDAWLHGPVEWSTC